MERVRKTEVVAELKEVFDSAAVVVVGRNNGITVAQADSLRKEIKKSKGAYKVSKNTLLKIAAKGTDFESLSELFEGPTSISYADDPVGITKALVGFSKKNESFEVTGAVMSGQFLSAEEVKKIASLPSLDELRGKLIGVISAPATKVAAVLQAPAGQIARLAQAYADKK